MKEDATCTFPSTHNDHSSTVAQQLFHEHMLAPKGKPPLHALENPAGAFLGTNHLIVAYHRPNNLCTLLFPCLFKAPADHPLSSFILDPAPAAEL